MAQLMWATMLIYAFS